MVACLRREIGFSNLKETNRTCIDSCTGSHKRDMNRGRFPIESEVPVQYIQIVGQ
ncbi:MAG: hypothetical protein K0U98_28430 [Deltaproteobacteria bacterium]|nr:hypothetical protein [Deltaproteobacteria bacterium]